MMIPSNGHEKQIVLGAGMSGMGAALSSQSPVYEATSRPGGVCHSYYIDEHGQRHEPTLGDVSQCFRFEPAGGHWMFGVSEPSLKRLEKFCRFDRYERKAAVFFPADGRIVPYPLQENLHCLDQALRDRVIHEIQAMQPQSTDSHISFKDWLLANFGPSLCELFFFPFNESYTAGSYSEIAPQDLYKSVPDRDRMLRSCYGKNQDTGYNCVFYYPQGGLDNLVRAIGTACTIHFEHRASRIDTDTHKVHFTNGAIIDYTEIISTIALNKMVNLCGIECKQPQDPATAVLVVNIGAIKGAYCPPYHWVYLPSSKSGIHRVGFYSHVDRSFLPSRYRDQDNYVTIYTERSFPADAKPSRNATSIAATQIVDELKEWGFIKDAIIVDTSYTDPAYTWSRRDSSWAQEAIHKLAQCGILQTGRYGAWRFQGMMESFEQGLLLDRMHYA